MKLFNLKEGFKEQLTDIKVQNVKIQRRIDETEGTIDGIKALLNDNQGEEGQRDPLKVMNPKLRAKLLADKKKREREILQKKIEAGVDFLGEGDVKINEKLQNQTFFSKLLDNISQILDDLKPFKREV